MADNQPDYEGNPMLARYTLAKTTLSELMDPTYDRLQLIRALVAANRPKAALREITNALYLAPFDIKSKVLQSVAYILCSMDQSILTQACFKEAIYQMKSIRESPRTIEKLQAYIDELDNTTIREQSPENCWMVLEFISVLMSKYPPGQYAGMLATNHRYADDFYTKFGCNVDFRRQVWVIRISISRVTSDMMVARILQPILDSTLFLDHLSNVKRGLFKKPFQLPCSVIEYQEMFNQVHWPYYGLSHSAKKLFAQITIKMCDQLVVALKQFQKDSFETALSTFQSLLHSCMACYESLNEIHLSSPKPLVALSISLIGVSAMYMLVCFLDLDLTDYSLLGFIRQAITISKEQGLQRKIELDYRGLYSALGKIEEVFAFQKATKVTCNGIQLLKPDNECLEICLQQYVCAIDACFSDNPMLPLLYDKLLWVVILHGGISLPNFWVLHFFRDLAYLQSDCSLISHEETDLAVDFFHLREHITPDLFRICAKLYRVRRQVQQDLPASHFASPEFFLPAALVDGPRLVIEDGSLNWMTDDERRATWLFYMEFKLALLKSNCHLLPVSTNFLTKYNCN